VLMQTIHISNARKLNTKMHKQTHTNREETNKILHSRPTEN